jgi:hypothetical protein
MAPEERLGLSSGQAGHATWHGKGSQISCQSRLGREVLVAQCVGVWFEGAPTVSMLFESLAEPHTRLL